MNQLPLDTLINGPEPEHQYTPIASIHFKPEPWWVRHKTIVGVIAGIIVGFLGFASTTSATLAIRDVVSDCIRRSVQGIDCVMCRNAGGYDAVSCNWQPASVEAAP